MTTITLPTLPNKWTPGTIVTFVVAVALAIIGGLTTYGVAIPAGVPADVQWIGGLASMLAAGAVALGHHAVHQSTVKAAIAANPGLVTAVPKAAPPTA